MKTQNNKKIENIDELLEKINTLKQDKEKDKKIEELQKILKKCARLSREYWKSHLKK
ncbi:hypothetical protein M1278_04015 [Candidatus Marsarchaeota archaeon]|nr:hypothetical protein [Candidatus Marsarchaeota archaeon]